MKISSICLILLFLVSCSLGVSAPETQTSSGETQLSGTSAIQNPTVSTGSNGTTPLPVTPGSPTPNTPASPSIPATSTKSEDEIVKDFEKDIEDLLNTVEKDAAKK